MNRLGSATSTYLLQHKDNPVDWWPWGAEPFEEAARRDVPILLSVGYASCHWCHVHYRRGGRAGSGAKGLVKTIAACRSRLSKATVDHRFQGLVYHSRVSLRTRWTDLARRRVLSRAAALPPGLWLRILVVSLPGP